MLFSSCRCVNETPAETCHRLAIRHEEEFIFRLTVPPVASIWLRTFNQSPCNIRINFVLGICVASYLFPAKDDFFLWRKFWIMYIVPFSPCEWILGESFLKVLWIRDKIYFITYANIREKIGYLREDLNNWLRPRRRVITPWAVNHRGSVIWLVTCGLVFNTGISSHTGV